MQLPNLKEIKRDEGLPETWEWTDREIAVYRPRLCLVFPKKAPGAIALLFEEAEFRRLKSFYIAYFETFTHTNELLARAVELARIYEVHDVFTRLTRTEQDFLRFFNESRKHNNRLSVRAVPNADPSGKIDYFLNLLTELQQADRERCFFPPDSDIPRLLAEVPEMAHEETDADYPALACVAYGVACLYHTETIEPEAAWKQKKYNPWSKLEGLSASDYMDKDIVRKSKMLGLT